jgi:hypothetical protein
MYSLYKIGEINKGNKWAEFHYPYSKIEIEITLYAN